MQRENINNKHSGSKSPIMLSERCQCRKAEISIYHQCIQGEHFQTIQQNHNDCASKLSRKLYPGREQLVSPSMRSFGAENCGPEPGIRVIKKKNIENASESVDLSLATESSSWSNPNHYQNSPLASHEKLAAQRWGVGGKKFSDLFCAC